MNGNEETNFRELGLRCGLEVHYQLDTQKKLFCHCPVGLLNRRPDAEIVRHMRPTLSELGEYDGTALMEFKTKKTVRYQLYYDSVCTYEMDDTPPFVINREALKIAVEIALLLNCRIADEIHVSRKQYLDGSIPTGFQRTIAVGVNGWIRFSGRKIRIVQVCLEEDACREVSDRGHVIVFRTDRLSTPLVEVITAPDIRTPAEASGVDREIGRILRATGKVRRGIGTVRQDVNVSIEGGTRVEIKGVPRTGMIERLVRVEALRQKGLLSLRETITARGAEIKTPSCDCGDLFCESECAPLRESVRRGLSVGAVAIPGFSGILHRRISPGKTFADELAGRVRVIACLDDEPVLFFSDEKAPCGSRPGPKEWEAVRRRLGVGKKDPVVLVRGPGEDVETALSEIAARVEEAKEGVPNETRQVLVGGETDFERILPGPDRMYPDTDSSPIPIAEEDVAAIRKRLPVTPDRWRKRCRGMLKPQTVDQLIDMECIDRFWKILKNTKCDPKFLAYTLTATLPALRRAGCDILAVKEKALVKLFLFHAGGNIIREMIPRALVRIASGRGYDDLSADIDEETILKAVERNYLRVNGRIKDRRKLFRYLVGAVKEETGFRASGRRVVWAVQSHEGLWKLQTEERR
ncbi:MAG: Glu-tRNA(Gln) amidotransferase subunit GatE [Spirochaetes bacterium]|nr:Glu-tRNA(Gln) amidotransferase subunit GatE [Spirochaetota bacterium]